MSPSLGRGRRALRRSALVLAGSAAALLAGEGLLRLLDPWGARPKIRMNDFVRAAKRPHPDPRRGWVFQGGFRGDYGVPVSLNAQGFRDAAWGLPEEGERRTLVLGDSFVFGYGVKREEAFPAVLEGLLGPPHRVLNGGVVGYNTDQAWRVLRDEGLSARPDIVLVLYVGNDRLPTLTDPRMARFRRASEAWQREHPFQDLLVNGPHGPFRYGFLYLGYYLQWKTRLFERIAVSQAVPGPEPETVFREALAGMRDDCAARGIRLAFLLYEEDAGVRRELGALGIPHRVLFASPREAEPYALCPVDSHPNPAGHRRIAEACLPLLAP